MPPVRHGPSSQNARASQKQCTIHTTAGHTVHATHEGHTHEPAWQHAPPTSTVSCYLSSQAAPLAGMRVFLLRRSLAGWCRAPTQLARHTCALYAVGTARNNLLHGPIGAAAYTSPPRPAPTLPQHSSCSPHSCSCCNPTGQRVARPLLVLQLLLLRNQHRGPAVPQPDHV